MKKHLAVMLALTLALLGFAVKNAVAPQEAAACGWFVEHVGSTVADQYWNPNLGYEYVYLNARIWENSCTNHDWQGQIHVWTTDGYNFTGGTVYVREGRQGGAFYGTWSCAAAGRHDFSCWGAVEISTYVMWDDDLNTLVSGPYGGNHGGYVNA